MIKRLVFLGILAASSISESAQASDWYMMLANNLSCEKRGSPAEKISRLQQSGTQVETKDLPDGGVEVGHYEHGTFYYNTFYPSKEQCEAAMPENKPIPDKYK